MAKRKQLPDNWVPLYAQVEPDVPRYLKSLAETFPEALRLIVRQHRVLLQIVGPEKLREYLKGIN